MRYEAGHKDETRARILRNAVQSLRREGVGGVGLSSAMRAAGLTVGGFYAHFRSRLALVDEALRTAMRESRERWFSSLDEVSGAEAEATLVRRYLSREHLEHDETTCPIASSVAALPKEDHRLRASFTEELREIVAFIEPRVTGSTTAERRLRALSIVATCVGALSLARAVDSPTLAREILTAGRRALVPTSRAKRNGQSA